MTTDEIAKLYENDEMVFGSNISHEELNEITNGNIDDLISKTQPTDASHDELLEMTQYSTTYIL